MSGQNFQSEKSSAWIVCVERSGNARDSRTIHGWVCVGMAVIFLVRAQALNFQIAPANKCCVDKRGKTVPTDGQGNEQEWAEKAKGCWKKREERARPRENEHDNGVEMVSAYVAIGKKDRRRKPEITSYPIRVKKFSKIRIAFLRKSVHTSIFTEDYNSNINLRK